MESFEKLSKDELLSILYNISLYVNESEFERKPINRELIYNQDGNLNESYNAGFESGVNVMCNAIRTFFKQ